MFSAHSPKLSQTVVVFFFLALPACSAPLRVQSSRLALTVDSESCDLLALKDVENRFNYLAEESTPAFLLQFRKPDMTSFWRDSRSAKSVNAERTENGQEQTLRIEYIEVEDEIHASVTVSARSDSPELRFRIDIENNAPLILEQVLFPLLRLVRPLGASEKDDRVFVPGGDGCVVIAEGIRSMPHSYRRYPGNASMQFLAYYDSTAGLSLTCRDTNGEVKNLGYSAEQKWLRLSLFQCRPFVPGQGYTSPPIVVQTCSGSWMSAAQSYKAWAREQWWAQPKTGESATPQWLLDSPLVLSGDFRPLGNGKMFMSLDHWAKLGEMWRRETGAENIMVECRNWEHAGVYTSPYYFPLNPSPEIVRRVMAELHQHGFHAQAMVAGLKWMVSREAFHTPHYNILAFDGREAFEKEGSKVCVIGRDGETHIRKAYFTWDGDHAFMCPATDFAREHFRKTARVLAQAGFDLFELDQMNGGSCPTCYGKEHGHPPGDGSWAHKAIVELMKLTRKEGRRYNRDFALSLEDPAELLLPYLDTYISRVNHLMNWPGSGPGSRVAPAFIYVYHPLLPITTLDLQHTCRTDDFLLLRTARAFVYGAGMATQLTPWQVLLDYGEDDLLPTPTKMDADQRKLLQALMRAHDGPGRPYLTRGELLPTAPLNVPSITYSINYRIGNTRKPITVTAPAIVHSAWSLPDGRVAFFFVNTTRGAVSFPFTPRTYEWSPPPGANVDVYLSETKIKTISLKDLKTLEAPGLSVVMVEYSASRSK